MPSDVLCGSSLQARVNHRCRGTQAQLPGLPGVAPKGHPSSRPPRVRDTLRPPWHLTDRPHSPSSRSCSSLTHTGGFPRAHPLVTTGMYTSTSEPSRTPTETEGPSGNPRSSGSETTGVEHVLRRDSVLTSSYFLVTK